MMDSCTFFWAIFLLRSKRQAGVMGIVADSNVRRVLRHCGSEACGRLYLAAGPNA